MKQQAQGPNLSPHEWAARGNQFLSAIGRRDVHWIVRSGRCVIEWRDKPGKPDTDEAEWSATDERQAAGRG